MSERLLVVANQSAGSLLRLPEERPLERIAREAGVEVEVVYSRSARHMERVLRDRVLGKRDRVVVAGGDGTIHRAVQLLAGSGVTLGILPQGTANNFATSLRLPRDLPSAFRVLVEGRTREVDLGVADGEYFTEAAGVGILADVLAITGGQHRLRNLLRGVGVVLRSFVLTKPRRIAIDIDGERHVEEAMNVTVANSFFVGYNLPIAPSAKVTDAKLDVVVVGDLTRREMISYYRAIRRQEHLALPKVTVVRATEVRLSTRHPAVVHVDDRTWRRTPVTIRVAPKALAVLVDRG